MESQGKTRICRLTTLDNPYDPFDQFDDWFAFDEQKGYHSCGLLARMCQTSMYLSDADQRLDVEEAIDTILSLDLLKIYKKVVQYV